MTLPLHFATHFQKIVGTTSIHNTRLNLNKKLITQYPLEDTSWEYYYAENAGHNLSYHFIDRSFNSAAPVFKMKPLSSHISGQSSSTHSLYKADSFNNDFNKLDRHIKQFDLRSTQTVISNSPIWALFDSRFKSQFISYIQNRKGLFVKSNYTTSQISFYNKLYIYNLELLTFFYFFYIFNKFFKTIISFLKKCDNQQSSLISLSWMLSFYLVESFICKNLFKKYNKFAFYASTSKWVTSNFYFKKNLTHFTKSRLRLNSFKSTYNKKIKTNVDINISNITWNIITCNKTALPKEVSTSKEYNLLLYLKYFMYINFISNKLNSTSILKTNRILFPSNVFNINKFGARGLNVTTNGTDITFLTKFINYSKRGKYLNKRRFRKKHPVEGIKKRFKKRVAFETSIMKNYKTIFFNELLSRFLDNDLKSKYFYKYNLIKYGFSKNTASKKAFLYYQKNDPYFNYSSLEFSGIKHHNFLFNKAKPLSLNYFYTVRKPAKKIQFSKDKNRIVKSVNSLQHQPRNKKLQSKQKKDKPNTNKKKSYKKHVSMKANFKPKIQLSFSTNKEMSKKKIITFFQNNYSIKPTRYERYNAPEHSIQFLTQSFFARQFSYFVKKRARYGFDLETFYEYLPVHLKDKEKTKYIEKYNTAFLNKRYKFQYAKLKHLLDLSATKNPVYLGLKKNHFKRYSKFNESIQKSNFVKKSQTYDLPTKFYTNILNDIFNQSIPSIFYTLQLYNLYRSYKIHNLFKNTVTTLDSTQIVKFNLISSKLSNEDRKLEHLDNIIQLGDTLPIYVINELNKKIKFNRSLDVSTEIKMLKHRSHKLYYYKLHSFLILYFFPQLFTRSFLNYNFFNLHYFSRFALLNEVYYLLLFKNQLQFKSFTSKLYNNFKYLLSNVEVEIDEIEKKLNKIDFKKCGDLNYRVLHLYPSYYNSQTSKSIFKFARAHKHAIRCYLYKKPKESFIIYMDQKKQKEASLKSKYKLTFSKEYNYKFLTVSSNKLKKNTYKADILKRLFLDDLNVIKPLLNTSEIQEINNNKVTNNSISYNLKKETIPVEINTIFDLNLVLLENVEKITFKHKTQQELKLLQQVL